MLHRTLWVLALVFSACGGGRANNGPGGAGGASNLGGAAGAMTSAGGAGGIGGAWAIPEPAFRDGTRLVARTFSFEGTSPLFVGIYDRQEHVECDFRAATDGKLRCLPANSVGAADPTTVEPSARWQEGVETQGVEMLDANTSNRLRRNEIHSADGGRFPNWVNGEFHDAVFGQPCRPNTTRPTDGTGDGLCLPDAASASDTFFADGACLQALASVDNGRTPFVAWSPERQVFALGDIYDGPAFIAYAKGGACMSFPVTGTPFYRIGAPLPAGTLAPIQMLPRGSGRLALQMIESESSSVAPVRHRDLSLPSGGNDGPYLDRQLGMLCRPTWTTSGEVRCVPTDSEFVLETWLTNFADPACTIPVVNSKQATAVLLRRDTALARQVVVTVRRVGASPSTTAYTIRDGACAEYLKGSGYPLGDEVPLESFARLEARTGLEP